MKPAIPLTIAGAFLVTGIMLIMTAVDQRADERAHLQFKQRLVQHFPDQALAELAAPLAGGAAK